jgi:myosin V
LHHKNYNQILSKQEKRIWVPDAAQIWRLAYIVKKDEAAGIVTVEPLKGGAPVDFQISETHGFDPSHESDLDDAAQLNNLHEAPLLDLISRRFKKVQTTSPSFSLLL